jgi:hypothetical protein
MLSTLQRSTYKPNLADPRVRKRIATVLAWCGGMRLSNKPRAVSHSEIREIFGNTDQKGLAQWLRARLLTRSGHYVPGKQHFSYRLNLLGYNVLHAMLEVTPTTPVEIAQEKFGDIISGKVAPQYNDTGDRRYHPIQNIERTLRKRVFSGWWDYDIESSAPTLVYQYAAQHYLRSYGSEATQEHPFPAVHRLVHDRAWVRSHVASLTGLDAQATKELINAIFFRANMAPSPMASIFRALGQDHARHQRLISDPFVQQLKEDVRRMWMWALLRDNYEGARRWLRGETGRLRPAKVASRRQAIYHGLERKVVDAVLAERPPNAGPYVLMHDGFMSRERVDIVALADAVAQKTGFTVRLSEVQLGSDKIDEDGTGESPLDGGEHDYVESGGVLV